MIGQSAIGHPRVFVDHIPTLQELQYRIIEHLQTVMACELFFDEQSKNYADLIENNQNIL
jgi:hypothetical protein